jgi:hypothetical protein
MNASLNIQEEHGIYTRTPHPHNGYCAGDFSNRPSPTWHQLAAVYRSPEQAREHERWTIPAAFPSPGDPGLYTHPNQASDRSQRF